MLSRFIIFSILILITSTGNSYASECGNQPTFDSLNGLSYSEGVYVISESNVDLHSIEERRLNQLKEKLWKKWLSRNTDKKLLDITIDKFFASEDPSGVIRQKLRKKVTDEMEEISSRTWCFDMYKINSHFFRFEVINVPKYFNELSNVFEGIKENKEEGELVFSPIDYSIGSLLNNFLFIQDNYQIIFNAGWSKGTSPPESVGFLRIDGENINNEYQHGLSSMLCISDNKNGRQNLSVFFSQFRGKYSFNEWYFKSKPEMSFYKNKFQKCSHAIQVGPRIVELNNSEYIDEYEDEVSCLSEESSKRKENGEKIGICISSLFSKPRLRTILVGGSGNEVFLIISKTPVTLYEVQEAILEKGWFGKDLSDIWALNLAGAKQFNWGRQIKDSWRAYNYKGHSYSMIGIRHITGEDHE